MRAIVLLALGLAATDAAAQGSAGPDCGGDAFSRAEIVEHRPARRGPLTATPDTLCADVAPQPSSAPVEIQVYPGQVYPGIVPQVGGGGVGAPYEGRSPRRGGPARLPDP